MDCNFEISLSLQWSRTVPVAQQLVQFQPVTFLTIVFCLCREAPWISAFKLGKIGVAISHFAISSVVTDRASGTTVGAIPTRDVFNYRLVLVQGCSLDKCFQLGGDRSGLSPWVVHKGTHRAPTSIFHLGILAQLACVSRCVCVVRIRFEGLCFKRKTSVP